MEGEPDSLEDELSSISEDNLDALFSDVTNEMEGDVIIQPDPPSLGPGSPTIKPLPQKIPKVNFRKDYDRTPGDFASWWEDRNKIIRGGRRRKKGKAPLPPPLPPQRTPKDALEDFGLSTHTKYDIPEKKGGLKMKSKDNTTPETSRKLSIKELNKLPLKELGDYLMQGFVKNLNRNVTKDQEKK